MNTIIWRRASLLAKASPTVIMGFGVAIRDHINELYCPLVQ
jgi:hypothetical protein